MPDQDGHADLIARWRKAVGPEAADLAEGVVRAALAAKPGPAPVPPEAVTLAAVALHDAECPDRHCSGPALGAFYGQARIALNAGAEAIRERFAETAVRPLLDAAEASAARIAELEELAANLRKALGRFENLEAAAQSKAALIAVAAERDRVVSLLRSKSAELRLIPEVSAQVAAGACEDAADLIGDDHD